MNKKFLILLLLPLLMIQSCADKKDPDSQATMATGPHYTLAKVERKNVDEVIKLPAQLAAYQQVSIFPKVNGYVKTVLVDIGSHVRQGQLLMELEAPELIQATVQAKEKYARTQADYTISKENYERLQQASLTPGAISPMDLASARAKMTADSALSNAEKANWLMQQTMLDYLRVTAPFSGVITQRNVHPGALVSAENKEIPMLELKEIDHLRLQVDIPESMAATLRTNDSLSFYLSAFPGKRMSGIIARKSMNISVQYRSERVELDVYNKSETLTPGMYADVLFNSKGMPNALSVPKSAVVTSTERKYVVVVRDGKTVKVDVTTGNQGENRIEVIGALQAGEEVIVNADDEIKQGITIK
ncbi:MAG TPA: efflux RND transporter periplasmic adaptor subunit [Puia sp.]|jgi:RND family efflux transporter MFP subunit|nr:efflux RND transporter periplasmic adaptor subunit [Puia sp.]